MVLFSMTVSDLWPTVQGHDTVAWPLVMIHHKKCCGLPKVY